jgi:hypothetical protein
MKPAGKGKNEEKGKEGKKGPSKKRILQDSLLLEDLFRGSAPAPPVVKHKAGPPKKEGVYN